MVTNNRLPFVNGRRKDFKLLAALVNPDGQFNEVCQRQLLDCLLDFFNLAQGRKITSFRGTNKTSLQAMNFSATRNRHDQPQSSCSAQFAPHADDSFLFRFLCYGGSCEFCS